MELDLKLYEKICDITGTDYELAKGNGNYVLAYHDVDVMLRDLVCAYGVLEEKLEDLKQDVKENYEPKKFNPWEEYGLNPNDYH